MNKSIYILFLLCISSFTRISAQPIVSYGFQSHNGTYTEISDGTIVGAGLLGDALANVAFDGSASGIKELTTSDGLPIGFNFVYNDLVMNKFIIGSYGYLALGKDKITIDPQRSAFMLMDKGEGKQNIVGLGVNTDFTGDENTKISYKVTGIAPGRVLVVQFKNLIFATDYQDGKAAVSLQIRLYEGSNKIEFIYKGWTNNSSSGRSTRVGLKGSDEDYHLRISTTNDWSNTQMAVIGATSTTINWQNGCFPADGLTYTFTIPQDCGKPASQPTDLKLTSSSVSIKGSFTPSSTADHYLTVITEEQALSSAPADKKTYKAGDMIGNGKVIDYSTLAAFETPEDLSGAKPYYLHIFAVNSFCSYGPLYNTNPLTGSISTKPVQPQALETAETGYDYATLKATKNAANNSIIIAQTNTPAYDRVNNRTIFGKFGTPSGELNIGDEIDGGGVVVYKGDAEEAIKIEGLSENSAYYFGAWSLDEKGEYSSISAGTRTLTWGKMPYYPALEEIRAGLTNFGWQVEGGTFRIATAPTTEGGAYRLECDIRVADLANGKINSVTTQWMLLDEGVSRIQMDYRMTTWSRPTGDLPYNEWEEGDLFEVQVSENGTDFTTVYSVNKATAPQLASKDAWASPNILFEQFSGKKVKVRLNWKCHKAVKLVVNKFLVEQKPACEYPVNLTVDESSLAGNNASVAWKSMGEENVWDIRFRTAGAIGWNTPIEVRSNPYMLTTLPASSNVEVQVRAKCSLTSFSPWSKSVTFTTGYAIPFTENFDSGTLPSRWSFESGILADPTEFCVGTSCRKNWKPAEKALKIDYSLKPKDWIISPKIDLGNGSVHGKLEFDLKLQKMNATPTPENTLFAVVISTDENGTFSDKNILRKWTATDFASIGENTHYSIDLSQYTGIVKLGFYAFLETSDSGDQLYIDNISLAETCPPARNAKASDVNTEAATISWEGEADEWLTFVRKAGETKKEYNKQTETRLVLSGLTAKTNYEVGITQSCAVNDTARVVIVPFTTQSLAPCLTPAEITVTPSKQSVSIAWTGEATNYNVKFRPADATEWISKTIETNSIEVDGLNVETEYEYTLQSVCSAAEGDTSQWTPVARFSTLAVSCFVPTEVNIVPTYKSATISWSGEAENYQISYREDGKAWIQKEVHNSKSIAIEDLTATTKYSIRLRSICAVGDTSLWSATTDFSTLNIPICSIPTNLRASGITDTSATLLWDADESNLTWDMHYRPGSVTSWTTMEKLNEKSCTLSNLIPNTAYVWSVKATCDEGRTSGWATQEGFTTEPSGIANANSGDLKVYTSNGVINVQNPQNVKIERICLYSTNGQIIKDFNINSDENVMIPVQLSISQVIVKIFGEGFTTSQNLLLNN